MYAVQICIPDHTTICIGKGVTAARRHTEAVHTLSLQLLDLQTLGLQTLDPQLLGLQTLGLLEQYTRLDLKGTSV